MKDPWRDLGFGDEGVEVAAELLAEHAGAYGWTLPVMVLGEEIDTYCDGPTEAFVVSFAGPDRCLVEGMGDEARIDSRRPGEVPGG